MTLQRKPEIACPRAVSSSLALSPRVCFHVIKPLCNCQRSRTSSTPRAAMRGSTPTNGTAVPCCQGHSPAFSSAYRTSHVNSRAPAAETIKPRPSTNWPPAGAPQGAILLPLALPGRAPIQCTTPLCSSNISSILLGKSVLKYFTVNLPFLFYSLNWRGRKAYLPFLLTSSH